MIMLFTKSVLNVWHLCIKRMTQRRFIKTEFYCSLPLQAETLLNQNLSGSFCKVIVLHLGDKLLAFSKPSTNQSHIEIYLKDAERGLLNYLGGYILRNLYRKNKKSSKETKIGEEKEQFMALLDSLHVDQRWGRFVEP